MWMSKHSSQERTESPSPPTVPLPVKGVRFWGRSIQVYLCSSAVFDPQVLVDYDEQQHVLPEAHSYPNSVVTSNSKELCWRITSQSNSKSMRPNISTPYALSPLQAVNSRALSHSHRLSLWLQKKRYLPPITWPKPLRIKRDTDLIMQWSILPKVPLPSYFQNIFLDSKWHGQPERLVFPHSSSAMVHPTMPARSLRWPLDSFVLTKLLSEELWN